MTEVKWMIYGATGETGSMIAEEAVRQGQRPILAGRSASKLAPLAQRLGLDWVACDLNEPDQLAQVVATVGVVLNVAGPFMISAPSLVRACLDAGVHYLDIAGEIPVLQYLFSQDQAARQRGIALIGSVGFGSVATNGLARYVADQLPDATSLEVAARASNRLSSVGATISTLRGLARGGNVYRNGRLIPFRLGKGLKTLRFPDGPIDIMPAPTGDLLEAYHATNIPNVTAYIPFQRGIAPFLPLIQIALSFRPLRQRLEAIVEKRGAKQTAGQEQTPKTSYTWARATAADGRQVEAWLELGEGYQFTAASSVQAVMRVLRDQPVGALTPAQAFGWDFVLGIEGVQLLSAQQEAQQKEEHDHENF